MPRIRLGEGAEFDLVRRILEGSEGTERLLVPPGDDCVVLEDGTALSTDLTVEDVHFRREWISYEEIGFRAVAVALSDLAAMAADPVGVLMSVALASGDRHGVGDALAAGAREALEPSGASLLGGDLSRSPGPLCLDVVAVGRTAAPVRRDGVQPGDEIWVTGLLGGSAAAVERWSGGGVPSGHLRAAFARPTPRLGEARWLADQVELHALIDLSDGLAGDAGHLAAASGVGIVLESGEIPVHPDVAGDRGRDDALALALVGGEDYELCFAAAEGAVAPLAGRFTEAFGVGLTRVGRAEDGHGVRLFREGRPTPLPGGFDHFAGEVGAR